MLSWEGRMKGFMELEAWKRRLEGRAVFCGLGKEVQVTGHGGQRRGIHALKLKRLERLLLTCYLDRSQNYSAGRLILNTSLP
jgi:hypothetical protein